MSQYDYLSQQQQSMLGGLGGLGGLIGQSSLGQYQKPQCNCPGCGLPGCNGFHSGPGEVIRIPVVKQKEEYKMFKSVRAYYEKYQDTILTVAAIFLLDHYMFDGKFKTKIEQIMESLINKATAKIHAIEEPAK